jgi:large subunit ribosomal protein L25
MLKLTAEPRQIFGKKLKVARAAGKLPVVIYGPKNKAESLFVAAGDFKKVWAAAGESAVVKMDVAGQETEVLIQEVAWHPTSGLALHADLYAIDKTQELEVSIPLNFTGEAPALKEAGSTLVKVIRELKISALASNLPHDIEVDLSPLATLDSQILVKDLKLPAGVRSLIPPETVVAAISVAKEESVEAELPPDLSAIEVEKKGKAEEDAESASPDAGAAE